jgi:hypothetical protein
MSPQQARLGLAFALHLPVSGGSLANRISECQGTPCPDCTHCPILCSVDRCCSRHAPCLADQLHAPLPGRTYPHARPRVRTDRLTRKQNTPPKRHQAGTRGGCCREGHTAERAGDTLVLHANHARAAAHPRAGTRSSDAAPLAVSAARTPAARISCGCLHGGDGLACCESGALARCSA